MNIAEYALKNKILVVAVLICLVVGGAFAYNSMSKLEDPEIKVKVAVVAAVYPGATAYETELEVTRPLEETIRRISEVGTVTSQSFDDMAIITVTLKTTTPDSDTQQEWDMLRRKVNDAKASLPASAQVMVMDDYGDVYGMFYALTFDGYGYEEAGRYADMVCRELSDIEGVSKAITYGERTRCVNIDMKADRMANLGVHPTELLTTLNSQNSVIYSGYFDTPDRRMKIEMGDAYESIEDIRNLIIQGHEDDQLKLSDVADVTYGWQTPVRNSMKYDGQPAIGLLISAESGTDIIKIGKEVEARLEEIKAESVPTGMEFHKVFFQPEIVGSSINTFIVNLIESIVIVILLLMLTMGFRSGVIIATSLVVIVFGSFFILDMMDGTLQRVSLGSFIVAMGILVDNAIVIVDGILVDMKRGVPKPQCLTNICKKTAMPLLGATVIAILAFFPIFMSPDMAGTYVRDLFIVLAVSLLLSWVLALTHVPVHCDLTLRYPNGSGTASESVDPFDSRIYRWFRRVLDHVLSHRLITVGIAVILVLGSVWCYQYIPQMFFPDMAYNQLYIEYRMPEGTAPGKVEKDLEEMEAYIRQDDNVNHVVTSLGGTPGRYCLVRAIADPSLSYGELIIDYEDYDKMIESIPRMQKELMAAYPEAYVRVKQYNLMYRPYPVEAMFQGPDPAVLKDLCAQAQAIMEESGATWLVTDDWSPMVPAVKVEYDQAAARQAGISRSSAGISVMAAAEGIPCGTLNEEGERIGIYIRSTGMDGEPVESIRNTPVWGLLPSVSSVANMETVQGVMTGTTGRADIIDALVSPLPLNTITSGTVIEWNEPKICHYNGQRAIKAQCNNTAGYTAAQARDAVKDRIEAIELPDGYTLTWLGEYDASRQSTRYLFKYFPHAIVVMLLIMIALFKDIKKPLIIVCCLPLVAIGIVFGMLAAGMSFGFVAMVGCLGIIGMMIKNGIVLIDEIDRQLSLGVEPYKAVVDSTLSRLRPVMMASMTTVLGMAPLLFDPLFGSLAVTIMGGLTVGTLITLVFLPVLYSLFFKIKKA